VLRDTHKAGAYHVPIPVPKLGFLFCGTGTGRIASAPPYHVRKLHFENINQPIKFYVTSALAKENLVREVRQNATATEMTGSF